MVEYKNIIIEKEDAEKLQINEPEYKVLRNFNQYDVMGVCHVRKVKGKLLANFQLNRFAKGLYPVVGYIKSHEGISIFAVGLCVNRNDDETIKPL